MRYVNPAFCHLADKPKEELVGNAFSAVVPVGPLGIECVALLDRVCRTGQGEAYTEPEHSAVHPLYGSYAMWPVLGAEDRMVGSIVQVAKSTRFHEQAVAMNAALLIGAVRQHELTETAEELNAQLREEVAERKHAEVDLKRANDDLERFAAAASHDLQEPLRGVSCYTQFLAAKLRPQLDLDPEAEQFMRNIIEGNLRMTALIRDMLAYAKVGDERQPGSVPVECGMAVKVALSNLKLGIEETHASITSEPLPSVNVDLPQLTQVFQNLIGNALKYKKPGCAPQIHIGAEFRANEWVVSVRDDGIGLDPRYTKQIFEIFKRLHGGQYAGTGVGLAICQRIVERHRGRIWATGETGVGATFFFTIPSKSSEATRAGDRH